MTVDPPRTGHKGVDGPGLMRPRYVLCRTQAAIERSGSMARRGQQPPSDSDDQVLFRSKVAARVDAPTTDQSVAIACAGGHSGAGEKCPVDTVSSETMVTLPDLNITCTAEKMCPCRSAPTAQAGDWWTDQVFPSGSEKEQNWPHGYDYTSDTSTPRPRRKSRAARMSSTLTWTP